MEAMDIFGYLLGSIIIVISLYNLILTYKKKVAITELVKTKIPEEIKKIDSEVTNGVISFNSFNSYKENIYNASKGKLTLDEDQYLYHNLFDKSNDKQIDYINELIGLSGSTMTIINNIDYNKEKK